ncbi:MAG TPA: D-alanine--D-alanine ligase family protein [Thermoanaerobaculia bacterium]|nr:D-alanine--D-alanine ligase family protein [Thermoanaerobaculia bacterium]
MTRVGVVFGGRSVEHRVSVASARTVAQGLGQAGHEVVPLGIAQDGGWVERGAAAAVLEGRRDALEAVGEPVAPTLRHLTDDPPEVLFPIVHGTWGEDGTLQGLAEMLDLPYVGADVTTSAVAMDKIVAKRALEAAGVPVVEYAAARQEELAEDDTSLLALLDRFEPPFFVKPAVGGSSVGVRKVDRRDELAEAVRFALRFDDAVLVERGIRGRELECAVLGYRHLEASEIGEIVPGKDFYDYEDKYLGDTAKLIAPAELPAATASRLRELAVEAFRALGGTGMARVDFLLEGDDRPYVNEINTLPGFTRISMYPRLWALSGVPLPELVDRLVKIAQERHRDRRRLDEGIKEFLASLGG